MPRAKRLDQRSRILNAAESAFADLGYEGASLREIVSRGQVNLPTVYYYFGSKQGLLEAVFQRRFGPLREQHLELLRQQDAKADGRPLTVAEVATAMLLPPLLMAATDQYSPVVIRLIGRIINEPDSRSQEMLRQMNQDVREEFLHRLAVCCPHLNREELCWRITGMWGAVGALLGNTQRLAAETGGAFDVADTPKTLARLVAYFTAAFQAPIFAETHPSPSPETLSHE